MFKINQLYAGTALQQHPSSELHAELPGSMHIAVKGLACHVLSILLCMSSHKDLLLSLSCLLLGWEEHALHAEVH